MQTSQKLSSQETTIPNLVLRVVDIPLTEASDSPKIAAWHMTPTEVRRHLLYNHSQVIQQEMKSDQRCKLYSIFCRKKPADLLCCIFTGWLTLGDIRTESISTRLGTDSNTIRYRFMILMFWWKDLLDAGFPVLAIDYRWLQMATICNKSITFHPKGALVTLQRWLTSERKQL